ncbi:AsnC family protein [Saccharopolyspora antimicrobica]|uniref:AsnC family protein n=1 Tax=Saccharopolyspora antimicrobica TaxID=455193 RepID=UPI000AC85AE5|nr:AsnC family protein [Saccharopolyspora antimicrobica]
MAGPDPVDVRLLSVVAEMGRAAVPEIAGRLGMDVRDVAARLAALSTTGLPLIVGVECDPQAIRNAVAAAQHWAAQNNMTSGPYPVSGPSGAHQVPSGSYPQPTGGYPMPTGGYPAPGYGTPSGPQRFVPGPPPTSFPQQPAPQDPMNVWGPPGSAAWARGDQQAPQPPARTGKVGSKLDVEGLEGERITILLVEVVDPADYLFTAAGYELKEGERSVVVHTELTNRGQTPFTSLPDLYLELIAQDGSAVAKSPVSLSSRPPHRIGVPPGETAGGHTVYVLPDSTELTAVRWTPRPGDTQRTLTWDITDL